METSLYSLGPWWQNIYHYAHTPASQHAQTTHSSPHPLPISYTFHPSASLWRSHCSVDSLVPIPLCVVHRCWGKTIYGDRQILPPPLPQINVAMKYLLEEVIVNLANVGIYTVFLCLNTLNYQYYLNKYFQYERLLLSNIRNIDLGGGGTNHMFSNCINYFPQE